MSHPVRIFEDPDDLYERLIEDTQITEIQFLQKLDELAASGFIETILVDDQYRFGVRTGLCWSDFVHIDDPIKKRVLLLLVENPKTFFVLFNTQKGKLRIAAQEISLWGKEKELRVVSFVFVSNDKTLADQSAEGFNAIIGNDKCEVITLSSNNKTITAEDIKTKIDAYEHNNYYKPLVIAVLANRKQIEKAVRLKKHIRDKARLGSKLRYGAVWDEADETYPQFRNTEFDINGEIVSMRSLLVDDTSSLHRLGFVTATDGDLVDSEDYPECANAYLYPIVMDENDILNYRAIHLPDAIIHTTPHLKANSNNLYAQNIVTENITHFKTPLILKDGTKYYRKTIVNSNARAADMTSFANNMKNREFHAITFNMYGLKLYSPGKSVKTYKTKNRKFNELLFYVYKKNGLHDAPLFIVGRRKVDRGLGFHYAPRVGHMGKTEFDGDDGILNTDGKEGLIWTDVILGRIDDKSKAVQKAGRGAGIIGHSPQYHGAVDYWTDNDTSKNIKHHNTIVDATNEELGSNSILQAKSHAESRNPKPLPPPRMRTYNISQNFITAKEAKKAFPTASKYNTCDVEGNKGTTHIRYRGNVRLIPTEEEARNSTDLGQGANTSPRIMPIQTNDGIRYIVISKTSAPVEIPTIQHV